MSEHGVKFSPDEKMRGGRSCCSMKHSHNSVEERKKSYLTNLMREAEASIAMSRPTPQQRFATVHPAVEQWFKAMHTQIEGRLTSQELQQAFAIFQEKRFSDATCKFVVRLFDLDKNGGLDTKEFESLYYYIKQWTQAFKMFDRDGSGYLDDTELDFALKHLDIKFSPEFLRFLIAKSDPQAKKISLDQFIITCIQIQKFTDEFKNRDHNYSGTINIKYEDFLEMILRCL